MQANPGKEIGEKDLDSFLYENNKQDVDLLIRTGGEQRVSNFLLWQLAYAELYFTDTKWPDFTREEYREIIKKVSQRERRFGYVSEVKNKLDNESRLKKNLKFVKNENEHEIYQ